MNLSLFKKSQFFIHFHPVPHVERLETPVYEQWQLFKVHWTMFCGSCRWSNDMQTSFHGWNIRLVVNFLNCYF
jgi:hypothetical protein